MDTRFKIIQIAFIAVFCMLLTRLYYWQVVRADELTSDASSQHIAGKRLNAYRGNILASDGSWLVANDDRWVLFAYRPDLTDSPRDIAKRLTPYLVEPEPQATPGPVVEGVEPTPAPTPRPMTEIAKEEELKLTEALMNEDLSWIPLARRVTTEKKKELEALKIHGLGFDLTEGRMYPEASSAAHLVGFVGKDNGGSDVGYFGLEGYYDLLLTGKPGFIRGETNPLGIPILSGSSKEVQAVPGVDLITSIDKTIQYYVQKRLEEGITKYGAKAGSVIVADPTTGGILAMAAWPSFDPRTYYDFDGVLYRNPMISDSFEPGSIFKPIVMAAGLDAKVVEPTTECDMCGDALHIDKYIIRTWDNKYHANSTMIDVIKHSDNVGMAFVAKRLGAEKMYDYLSRFGFGKLTGIDLQGEATPELRKKGTWNEVDLATSSFGQGIAVTPIQMVQAIMTIARKGVPIAPRVVTKIVHEGWEEEKKPIVGKRVISEKAAAEITDIMVQAAAQGEAKWAIPKGFKIAGKTGTAQIPVSGHYDEEKTNASFIGFAPAQNPRFVMLVILREPESSQWASETAAPLWFDIARDLFPYLGVQPSE